MVVTEPCQAATNFFFFFQSIETIKIDGSGRHTFPEILMNHEDPVGLAVFESTFFWADEDHLVSVSWDSLEKKQVLLNASISAFTVLHELQHSPCELPHFLLSMSLHPENRNPRQEGTTSHCSCCGT